MLHLHITHMHRLQTCLRCIALARPVVHCAPGRHLTQRAGAASAARMVTPTTIALFDVDGTLTAPRKVCIGAGPFLGWRCWEAGSTLPRSAPACSPPAHGPTPPHHCPLLQEATKEMLAFMQELRKVRQCVADGVGA